MKSDCFQRDSLLDELKRTLVRETGTWQAFIDLVLSFLARYSPPGLYLLDGDISASDSSNAGMVVESGLGTAPRFELELRFNGAGASDGIAGVSPSGRDWIWPRLGECKLPESKNTSSEGPCLKLGLMGSGDEGFGDDFKPSFEG